MHHFFLFDFYLVQKGKRQDGLTDLALCICEFIVIVTSMPVIQNLGLPTDHFVKV